MSVPEGMHKTLKRLPSLVLTAALIAIATARAADAQTVMVRSAPPGSTIELTMNGGTPVSATADAEGDATLSVPARTSEDDVQVHVDVCGNLVKVLMVSRGVQPSAGTAGCTRTDFPSTFLMRPVTTFVVDITEQSAAVHVTQGPPPPEWVRRGPAVRTGVPWSTPTPGLALSAGFGFSMFGNASAVQCGTASPCTKNDAGGAVSLGADYWITRNIAAHIGYLKPADV